MRFGRGHRRGRRLEEGPATLIHGPSPAQSVFVSKTLLERGRTLLSIYCAWLLSHEDRRIK